MSLAYAPKGLFGVLTPQANTTVEPEFAILTPPGMARLTARLTSTKPSMTDRLVDYIEAVRTTLDRFANAPIKAAAFACTGASYLVGPEREAELCNLIESARGYPLITAGNAIAEALDALEVKRIGFVSPYGEPLTEAARGYWAKRNIQIAKLVDITSDSDAFHPIYALDTAKAASSLEAFDDTTVEAIVLLGTGLPTLPAIAAKRLSVPVLSSNLCLVWRAAQHLRSEPADAASLKPWLDGACWSLPGA